MTNLKIERLPNSEGVPFPVYETAGSAGMDLRAAIHAAMALEPGDRALIPTGFRIALEPGFEAQVRPRSGLALKHGITVLNSPGTIDSDYRGEVGIILANFGGEPFTVNRGDRIAQMVVARYDQATIIEVSALEHTTRGAGGFGSTGK